MRLFLGLDLIARTAQHKQEREQPLIWMVPSKATSKRLEVLSHNCVVLRHYKAGIVYNIFG